MEDSEAIAFGFIKFAGSIAELRTIIKQLGFTPSEGDTHHVSIKEFSHLLLREFSSEEYQIEADANTLKQLISDMNRFSLALKNVNISHSIEVYDCQNNLCWKKRVN